MKILILDDQRSARRVLRKILEAADAQVHEAATAAEAFVLVHREQPDLLLVDIRLSEDPRDRGGIDFVSQLRRETISTPVIIVTVLSEFADIRGAMRAGAQDYLLKEELSADIVHPILGVFRDRMTLGRHVSELRAQVHGERGADSLLGRSSAMDTVRVLIRRAANSTATVLITGETGTGKERVARALHAESSRSAEPFVAVNCAALPSTLVESLLFGHERGAFTGADRRRTGAFEGAGTGTLLLDEIGDMPMDLQAKLLRVLEERKVHPLGSDQVRPFEARVVAATNANLEERVAAGRFRGDLFYRLNVIRIDLPPLDQRRQDIPELLVHFLAGANRPLRLHDDAVQWFMARPWPGGVRELRNAVERLLALHQGETVDRAAMDRLFVPASDVERSRRLRRAVDEILGLIPDGPGSKLREVERALLHHVVEMSGGNKSQAARLLNTPRTSLERKLESLQRGEADDVEH